MFEDDGIKRVRDEAVPASSSGARPRRKKGFYRALKRGEEWAIYQKSMIDNSERHMKWLNEALSRQYYSHVINQFKK